MTFTKVTNTGIGSTGTVLLQNLDVIGIVTAGFGVSTVDVFTTGVSTFSGITNITNTTDSTSSTTGALIVTGGVGIAASLNVGGSVSVGGTLTYEDVTNVDSVGIITARSGIKVGSGITLSVDGDSFATGVTTVGSLAVSTGFVKIPDSIIHVDDSDTKIRFPEADTISAETNSSERLRITSDGKIGIGTTNPAGILHLVTPNSDCELILESDTENDDEYDNPKILFRQDGGYNQSCVGIGGTTNDSALHNALTLRNSAASASGIIFMTNTVAGQGHLESVERLRIHGTGAIGLSGENYGSDNQALTSKGSGTPPEWRGINTPAWDSYATSATNIPTGAWTTVGGLSETFDTNGAFASSAFTVPAGGAGTYFIYGVLTIDDIQSADYIIAGITKKASGESSYGDPSVANRGFMNTAGSANARIGSVVNTIMTLAVGDAVRLAALHNEGSTEPTEPTYTRFGGYRLSI